MVYRILTATIKKTKSPTFYTDCEKTLKLLFQSLQMLYKNCIMRIVMSLVNLWEGWQLHCFQTEPVISEYFTFCSYKKTRVWIHTAEYSDTLIGYACSQCLLADFQLRHTLQNAVFNLHKLWNIKLLIRITSARLCQCSSETAPYKDIPYDFGPGPYDFGVLFYQFLCYSKKGITGLARKVISLYVVDDTHGCGLPCV